uniref:SAM_MT_RSMB_NOP domain-containing protein n=1 Tax=Macrostomum lignano TaxID=282301 RepID=A0A1I8F8K0_9PLAT
ASGLSPAAACSSCRCHRPSGLKSRSFTKPHRVAEHCRAQQQPARECSCRGLVCPRLRLAEPARCPRCQRLRAVTLVRPELLPDCCFADGSLPCSAFVMPGPCLGDLAGSAGDVFHPHLAERLRGVRLDSNTTDSSQDPATSDAQVRSDQPPALAQPAEFEPRLSADGFVAIDDAEGGDVDSACDPAPTWPPMLTSRICSPSLRLTPLAWLFTRWSPVEPSAWWTRPAACRLSACSLRQGAWVAGHLRRARQQNPPAGRYGRPAGRVLAVDRDAQRFGELRRRLVAMGAGDRVRCLRCDCLQLGDRLSSGGRDRITHILVDPSCSGSGLTARSVERQALDGGAAPVPRMRIGGSQESSAPGFSGKFPALTDYPSARRVVYSTCSVHSEENEAVVQELANSFADKGWRLARLMKSSWPTRGLSAFDCGPMCLRAGPGTDRTCGFFVACFKRTRRQRGGCQDCRLWYAEEFGETAEQKALSVEGIGMLKYPEVKQIILT